MLVEIGEIMCALDEDVIPTFSVGSIGEGPCSLQGTNSDLGNNRLLNISPFTTSLPTGNGISLLLRDHNRKLI